MYEIHTESPAQEREDAIAFAREQGLDSVMVSAACLQAGDRVRMNVPFGHEPIWTVERSEPSDKRHATPYAPEACDSHWLLAFVRTSRQAHKAHGNCYTARARETGEKLALVL